MRPTEVELVVIHLRLLSAKQSSIAGQTQTDRIILLLASFKTRTPFNSVQQKKWKLNIFQDLKIVWLSKSKTHFKNTFVRPSTSLPASLSHTLLSLSLSFPHTLCLCFFFSHTLSCANSLSFCFIFLFHARYSYICAISFSCSLSLLSLTFYLSLSLSLST